MRRAKMMPIQDARAQRTHGSAPQAAVAGRRKLRKRKTAAVLMAAALALSCFALAGCSGEVTTDNTGGLTDEEASASSSNLVNPAQLPDSSFIYDASIIDLQTADSYMEGQTVQVIGEVVGDLIASDYNPSECWITLQANDGTYAEISVSMTLSQAKAIDLFGSYGKRGTTLQVRGPFSLACADHEGLTDIHADHVSVVSRGQATESQFDAQRFVPGLLLVALGAGLMALYWRLSERRR